MIIYTMIGIVLAPVLLGIVCGLILSVIFNLFSKRSNDYNSFIMFGVDSATILTIVGTFLLATVVVALSGMSVMMRDWDYIKLYPVRFVVELICATLLPSISMLVMGFLRTDGRPPKEIWIMFIWSCLQFGLLYILLQVSGIYSILLPNTLDMKK